MLSPSPTILSTDNVTVDFDGFKAVLDLNFSLGAGEVRFLIGPNGAGKTTLLDVLCGRVKPTKGHVRFKNGIELTRKQEHQIAQLGIGRKFQAPSIFASLTVRDNLELAASGSRGLFAALKPRVGKATAEKVDAQLANIKLTGQQHVLAGSLAHGAKQWLEIGMLLMQDPAVILLDEPAAGMTDHETEQMGHMLHELANNHTIMVVEHDMEFVRRFARKVTVMHEGQILCEGTMDEVSSNDRVAEVYLGRREERK